MLLDTDQNIQEQTNIIYLVQCCSDAFVEAFDRTGVDLKFYYINRYDMTAVRQFYHEREVVLRRLLRKNKITLHRKINFSRQDYDLITMKFYYKGMYLITIELYFEGKRNSHDYQSYDDITFKVKHEVK